MADTEPVQNISSRVRSVIISCHEHNTDHLPQLPSAAVRPGLQQGILPSPLSLGQDAAAVRREARGLPARLPVWQAGNTDFWLVETDHVPWILASDWSILGLGGLVDKIRKVNEIWGVI